MTKQELSNKISRKSGIEASVVKTILETAAEEIMHSLAKGENYYQRNFGTFMVITRQAKVGQNISKGTPINIPAHFVPKFKPCKEFMQLVRN